MGGLQRDIRDFQRKHATGRTLEEEMIHQAELTNRLLWSLLGPERQAAFFPKPPFAAQMEREAAYRAGRGDS